MSTQSSSTSGAFPVIQISSNVWQVTIEGGVTLQATGIIRDRGAIRATVTVYRGDAPLYPDKVNLTSGLGRRKFLKGLTAVTEIVLPETVLIALGEALRQPPTVEVKRDGSGDISGKAPETLAELEAEVDEYLLLDDPDVFPVLLAIIAAHRRGGAPVWLFLVGPPSGAKTELILMMWRVDGVVPLSKLTARTLVSGLKTTGREPSLLGRLSNEILIFKEFTTVLQLRRDERQEILAQLREIYDGRFDTAWGTGKEFHWEGRLGFIAGVTPVIDKYHSVMAMLGQRFVLLRLRQPDRQKVARRAIENLQRNDVEAMRRKLAERVAAFMTTLPAIDPELPNELVDRLALLADFVSRARSAVDRDGYKRELDYAPEPEMPPRLVIQYVSLARGLALIHHRGRVTTDDIQRVERIGLDCLPHVRRFVLGKLVERRSITLALRESLSESTYSVTTMRRALEDLCSLGVVECTDSGPVEPDLWSIRQEWRVVAERLFGIVGVVPCALDAKQPNVPSAITTDGTASGVSGTGSDALANDSAGVQLPANPPLPRSARPAAIPVARPRVRKAAMKT